MSKEILSKEFELLKIDIAKAYNDKGMKASGKFEQSLEVIATDSSVQLWGEYYANQLNDGRASGKFPPIAQIKQWVIDKGTFSNAIAEIGISSLAFLIARKIAREGWKRQGYGGVDLLTEVVTQERIQKIINEVGVYHVGKFTSEITNLFKNIA